MDVFCKFVVGWNAWNIMTNAVIISYNNTGNKILVKVKQHFSIKFIAIARDLRYRCVQTGTI